MLSTKIPVPCWFHPSCPRSCPEALSHSEAAPLRALLSCAFTACRENSRKRPRTKYLNSDSRLLYAAANKVPSRRGSYAMQSPQQHPLPPCTSSLRGASAAAGAPRVQRVCRSRGNVPGKPPAGHLVLCPPPPGFAVSSAPIEVPSPRGTVPLAPLQQLGWASSDLQRLRHGCGWLSVRPSETRKGGSKWSHGPPEIRLGQPSSSERC